MDQDTLAAGAIGAFASLLLTKGWPVLQQWLDYSDKKEDKHATLAREGPMMVNALLVQAVAEAKESINSMSMRLEKMIDENCDCHETIATLTARCEYLAADVGELRAENAQLKAENKKLQGGDNGKPIE